MKPKNTLNTIWKFTDNNGSFSLENPGQFSRLYFPLANEAGMLSNITPKLKGSIQTGQDAFLTLPISAEDLHNSKSSRNFWVSVDKKHIWSATGVAKNKAIYKESVTVCAGLLWHQLIRDNATLGIKSKITNFIPSSGESVEVMLVELTNTTKNEMAIEAYAATPLYARSADNLRDHRHVTSLLHRIELKKHGIIVTPTMTFDERGHHINKLTYAILGFEAKGQAPERFYPTVESFIGEGGSFEIPKALFENHTAKITNNKALQGKEAMGAFKYRKRTLKPGQSTSYIIVMGITEDKANLERWKSRFGNTDKVISSLNITKHYWKQKSGQTSFETKDHNFDNWLHWVGMQPTFRKLFGNSFLPEFDYGRGGRGWRDLWQDCLALILTDLKKTQSMLLHNFAGIRIDGSNATIIATTGYKFIADRNQISRVWMDHGVWPLITTELYIHETGDIAFLLKKAPYFRDTQLSRGDSKDMAWSEDYGTELKVTSGRVYQGTLIEHILVQHLVQFFNVGQHNHIRLEDADWNDGMDMASLKGESVAFTAFYAGNLLRIAELLEYLATSKKIRTIQLAQELAILLDNKSKEPSNYDSISYKIKLLKKYFKAVQPRLSGKTVSFEIDQITKDLRIKSLALTRNIQTKEWIKTKSGYQFYNGYYDNQGRRVEGDHRLGVRMTLTGQVFAIMNGIAKQDQIPHIIKSVKHFLQDKTHGGLRLNTDFKEIQPDLGRAFSFAYGEKENGAFFNHMQVMMANALYKRGCAKEGYDILENIYQMSINTTASKIYPGLPEYFNSEGRGMYHFLTGSASWYFMTLLTESFGIKGHYGNLLIAPKFDARQFVHAPIIHVGASFAQRRLRFSFSNVNQLSYGKYYIGDIHLNGKSIKNGEKQADWMMIPRQKIEKLTAAGEHHIEIILEKKQAPKEKIAAISPILMKNIRKKNLSQKDAGFKEKSINNLPDLAQFEFRHL